VNLLKPRTRGWHQKTPSPGVDKKRTRDGTTTFDQELGEVVWWSVEVKVKKLILKFI